jgi:hypothetical protein
LHAKSDWPLAILAVGFSVEENINLLLRMLLMVMGARFVVTDTLCLRLLQQIKKWGGRRDSKSETPRVYSMKY